MKVTEKAKVFLVLGIFFAIARIFDEIPLYCVFYVCLALVSISGLWARAIKKVQARVFFDTELSQVGSQVKVLLEIENYSYLPIPWGQCWVKYPETFGLKENLACYTFSLKPRQKIRINDNFECMLRGVFDWGYIGLVTGDGLGIFKSIKEQPCPHTLTVWPRAFNVNFFTSQKKIKRNDYFSGIRRHIPGESMTRVYWKMAAKKQDLFVKETAGEIFSNVTIIVDADADRHVGFGAESSFEKAVTTAATIANAAYKAGHEVKVITGDEYVLHANISRKGHLRYIFEGLTVLKTSDRAVFNNLVRKYSLNKQSSKLCLITGILDSVTVDSLILYKRMKGECTVFLIKLDTFEDREINFDVNKKAVLQLQSSGIKVVPVEKNSDLRLMCRGSKNEAG